MAGRGPAPKPADQRARRNATAAMTRLPSEGRSGKAPRWPLIDDIVTRARRDMWAGKVERLADELEEVLTEGRPVGRLEQRLDQAREELAILELRLAEQRKLERALWRELWRTPQAIQWERLGWTREVAQYVRHKVLAELGELDDAKEARQWSDRLGLTPLALQRLRWEIAEPEAGSEADSGSAAPGAAARRRWADLRVVGDSATS